MWKQITSFFSLDIMRSLLLSMSLLVSYNLVRSPRVWHHRSCDCKITLIEKEVGIFSLGFFIFKRRAPNGPLPAFEMLSGPSLVWLASQIQRWTHLDPFFYSLRLTIIVDWKCSCSTFNLLNPVYPVCKQTRVIVLVWKISTNVQGFL
jgi:hypothetical protein